MVCTCSIMGCDYLSQMQFYGTKKTPSIGISHIKSDSSVSRKGGCTCIKKRWERIPQQSLMEHLIFEIA